MSKDAVATMGTILTDDVGGRDAVHVAVIAVRSTGKYFPGTRVGAVLVNGEYVTGGEPVGIVDPFLENAVQKGQRFWLYLYPRTITALSHRWSHPAFGDEANEVYAAPADKLASEQWIRGYLQSLDSGGLDLETLIRVVDEGRIHTEDGEYYGYSINEDYLCSIGADAGGEIDPKLWDHLEVVMGRKITTRPTYFSCAC